ncbi:MAG: hypothetical protein LBF22_10805, partial [Deltaproteobacteria bacterium]|nr:hypothetical protein [Deltaproteobacteria bacterium]
MPIPRKLKVILTITFVMSLIYLVYLLQMFFKGFDFTDEAVYLFVMQRPSEYTSLFTLAGFIYHPLFLICGGN